MPQGVTITTCQTAEVTLRSRVSNLKILDCTNCTFFFAGSVSNVEVVRCTGCTFVCTRLSSCYQIEHTHDSKFVFPKDSDSDRVEFFTHQTSGLTLVAQDKDVPDGDIDDATDIVHELKEPTEAPRLGDEAATQGLAVIQFQTTWDGESESFSHPKTLSRQALGYFEAQ
jgi:Adenylate cyclase associated (CAP) C terminal